MGWESNVGNLLATDDGRIYVSYHTQGVPGPPNHPGYEIMVLSHCEGCTDSTATNYLLIKVITVAKADRIWGAKVTIATQ